MKIKGISIETLTSVVAIISHQEYRGNITFKRLPEKTGNFVFFTLTVLDSSKPGAKRSATGRRISAACWHAHRDIMLALFEHNPDALLVTAMARYEGLEGFERNYPATGDVNIGSMFEPRCYADACECEDY